MLPPRIKFVPQLRPGNLCTVGGAPEMWLPLLYKTPEDIEERLFGGTFLTVTRTIIRGDQIVMFLGSYLIAGQRVYQILWEESIYYTLVGLYKVVADDQP